MRCNEFILSDSELLADTFKIRPGFVAITHRDLYDGTRFCVRNTGLSQHFCYVFFHVVPLHGRDVELHNNRVDSGHHVEVFSRFSQSPCQFLRLTWIRNGNADQIVTCRLHEHPPLVVPVHRELRSRQLPRPACHRGCTESQPRHR